MSDLKRAFAAAFAIIILALIMLFAFELINETVSKSGFSSGEVFVFEFEKNIFSGEIFGRKFSANLSPFAEFLPKLGFLLFLFPPFIRLGFILVWALF